MTNTTTTNVVTPTHVVQVVRSHADELFAESAKVSVEAGGFTWTIEVFGPTKRYGSSELSPAVINWAGCGSQTAEVALAYAAALTVAAELAPALWPATGAGGSHRLRGQ